VLTFASDKTATPTFPTPPQRIRRRAQADYGDVLVIDFCRGVSATETVGPRSASRSG